MKKEKFIEKYGEEAYEKKNQQTRDWYKPHREEEVQKKRKWRAANPEKVKVWSREQIRKGGKRYKHFRQHQMTGIPHEKKLVRDKHTRIWRPYKKIIAPGSQIHHEWIPETANYRGVALVEKDQHIHGFIDVIQILEGEITLLTEISHT